ncbi:hypothetical protein HJP15_08435 [Pseudoalteromonas sp. NEC-BIFX-2020_002]|uniref:Uncharacterized protein n=1 Tax=Pseudoalteromonas neustonica TaxID=1840331 RepID=A0ABU9U459_9GAMM|nr:hypothetical protein [Pseudoalteromonas sp. NEC-BIFX-2020_002]NNG42938.1 hypothetical protein [Pseudoalteromonas sp. NEC-BIFX-2020_002]
MNLTKDINSNIDVVLIFVDILQSGFSTLGFGENITLSLAKLALNLLLYLALSSIDG